MIQTVVHLVYPADLTPAVPVVIEEPRFVLHVIEIGVNAELHGVGRCGNCRAFGDGDFSAVGLCADHDDDVLTVPFCHCRKAVAALEGAKTGVIPIVQGRRIHGNFTGASRPCHPLGEGVLRLCHVIHHAVGADAELSFFPIHGHEGEIRFVVELPCALQTEGSVQTAVIGCGSEIVTADEGLVSMLRTGGFYGNVLGNLPVHAEDGHIVLPVHGNENRDPANSTSVLEQHREPVPVGGVHDAALCNALSAVVHVVAQSFAAGEFAFQRVGNIAGFRPHPVGFQRVDQGQIVFAAYLVKMGAFVAQIVLPRIGDNDAV